MNEPSLQAAPDLGAKLDKLQIAQRQLESAYGMLQQRLPAEDIEPLRQALNGLREAVDSLKQ